MKLTGIMKLAIVCPGPGRPHGAIVLLAGEDAVVIQDKFTGSIQKRAEEAVNFVEEFKPRVDYQTITVDAADDGWELAEEMKRLFRKKNLAYEKEIERFQAFSWDTPFNYPHARFADRRSEDYWKLKARIDDNALKIHGDPGDLDRIGRSHKNGKIEISDRETLEREGINAAVPDALALSLSFSGEVPEDYEQPTTELMFNYGYGELREDPDYDIMPDSYRRLNPRFS